MKKNLLLGALLACAAFLVWAFWELFHCSFHICRDWSLLDLPGVRPMMLRKIALFVLAAAMFVVLMKKRRRPA